MISFINTKRSREYPDTKYRRRSAFCFSSFRFFSFVNLDKRRPIFLLFTFKFFSFFFFLFLSLFLFLIFNLSRVRLVKYIDRRRLYFFRCRVCAVFHILIFFWLLVVNVVLIVYFTYLTCEFPLFL